MESLGDYTILKQLGAGAFGSIYLAEHKFIKKNFALKVLPAEVGGDPSFMKRFEEEVQRIAALDHPNIAKIQNVSYSEGLYYLVMDPIVDSLGETMNLDRYLKLKREALGEDDLEDLLKQIASALDYAHEKNVLHGSLKLTNVMVAPTNDGVKFLLTDFGITRLIGEGLSFLRLCEKVSKSLMPNASFSSERTLEQNRNFIKSFAFLAPEQKALDGSLTDIKVDTYAFGVLAYFALTSKIPEGRFDLPSHWIPNAKKNWDLLITKTLQLSPSLRPKELTKALNEYLYAPLEEKTLEEQKEENIHQMAFEFSSQNKKSPQKVSVEKQKEMIQTNVVTETETPKPVLKPTEIERPEYEPDPGAIFQRELSVSHYVPKKVEHHDVEPILTEMIIIEGGSYMRGGNDGARDEMPRHAVHLLSFALDVHPITNEQFVRFIDAMGGEKDRNNNDIIRLRDSRIKRSGGKLIIESGYAKHPVVGVTWYGATAYANWIGKRLPTEAEWEAAATSGKENYIYPTGIEIERTQANFFSSDTTAVMSYPPNPLGLYDMVGNVYEWCQDWYAYNYYDTSILEPDNPKGPPQGVYRVLRGGCWKSLKEDLRSSHRHRNNPGAVNGTYGFRCAADVS